MKDSEAAGRLGLCQNVRIDSRRPILPLDPQTAFVSYSREDLEFVLRLAKDLKAHDARIWMDKLDIRAGQRWENEIDAALNICSRLVVVLSPACIASLNVMAEVAFGIDEGKQVIPALYRECRIPFRLRPFQYADFRSSYDEGLRELLASLKTEEAETVRSAGVERPPEETLPLLTSSGRPPQQHEREKIRRPQETPRQDLGFLKSFTTEKNAPWLAKPFTVGDFVGASNGHALIAVRIGGTCPIDASPAPESAGQKILECCLLRAPSQSRSRVTNSMSSWAAWR